MELHKFLDDARERKGLLKYRVWKLISLNYHISLPYVCRIFNEPTNPSKKILRKVCKVLDIEYKGVSLRTKNGEVWNEGDED